MNSYEHDATVPYWRSDSDIEALFLEHATYGHRLEELLDSLCIETDNTCGHVALMHGVFQDVVAPDHCCWWTFTPGSGSAAAIVLPVVEHGRTVDIVACGGFGRGWGCVTGYGKSIGTVTSTDPLRVYKSAQRWLQWGCDGVLPLVKSALPKLSAAPLLIAEDLDHVEELAHRVFVLPAAEHGDAAIAAAEQIARTKVGVDNERYDVDNAIFQRAALDTIGELRRGGLFE